MSLLKELFGRENKASSPSNGQLVESSGGNKAHSFTGNPHCQDSPGAKQGNEKGSRRRPVKKRPGERIVY